MNNLTNSIFNIHYFGLSLYYKIKTTYNMKKEYLSLLGKDCKPIVSNRIHWDVSNCDAVGQLPYLNGDQRIKYGRACVSEAKRQQREENRTQNWTVWAIYADGTFQLLSDMGFSQDYVSRNEFRIIK